MGQVKFLGGLVLFLLFSIAVITFAVNFGLENDAASNLRDDSGWNDTLSDLEVSVETFKDDINTSSQQFQDSEIQEGETVRTGGQFKVGPANAISNSFIVIGQGFKSIFGQDTGFGIFLTALTAFIVFLGIVYGWKLWKGGNPD